MQQNAGVILEQWKNDSTPGGGSSSSKSGGNAVVDPSIDLGAGDLHRVGPFRYLRFDESGKLRRRAGLGHRAELGESGFDLLACERLIDERIELAHDGGRGAGGCNHAGPDVEGDIWKALFEHGWNLRHLAPPLRAR